MMADAIKDLVSDAQPQEKEKPAEEKIVEPPADATAVSMPTEVVTPNAPDTATTEPQASAKEDEQSSSDDDSSTVAHKKIIKPITDDSVAPQSDLSELLAKEGITNEEDETHPAPNANPPSQPQVPGGLPTTPHPPGHIISPNDQGGVDPSSISL